MADDRTRVAGNTVGAPRDADSTRVSATPVTPVTPPGDAGQGAFGVARRAAPAAVQVGEVLGHTYRIEAFLAKGGMGAVYRARHVVLESEHAIKIILSELSEDPQVIALLNQEARTLRTVKNDAVVEYQGLMLDEHGRRYLVMEFADGPSLAAVLKERRFTPAEVRALRDRMASGLAAAHEKGIYHRDISPDNVILPGGRIENAKIIDFGIAKSTATGEKTIIGGDFAGKYSYASPEQAGMHGGRVDARSDIYSLGLVLASAAIGFGGKLDMGNSLSSVFEARQKVPDLSKLPAELRGEIAAMLQPKPEDRPQSMQQLVGGAGAASSAGAARPAAPGDRAAAGGRQGTRSLAITVAAISFAVVVLLGAAYFLLFPSRPSPAPEVAAQPPPTLALPTPEPAPPPAVLPPSPPADATPAPALAPKEALVQPPLPANPPDIAARIRAATEGYQCADLRSTQTGDGGFRLEGFVSSAADLASLRGAISGIPMPRPLIDAVAVFIPPHCEVAKLLNETAMPGGAALPARLEFNQASRVYRDGDVLIVTATAMQDGYLYVDLYDNEGNVVHALPHTREHPNNRMSAGQSVTLGSKRNAPGGRRVYDIAAPFGPWMVTAIASPTPLFAQPRAEGEAANAYLPALAKALRAAAAQPSANPVVATYTPIDTQPR